MTQTRKYLAIKTHDSLVAVESRRWLDAFLASMTYEGISKVDGSIHVFSLTGRVGCGLLAESWSQVEGRPGVYRVQTSAWVSRPGSGQAFVLEVALHSWDAGTEATITGDRHWLEVPKRQMYAERDRRSAAVAAELDQSTITAVAPDVVPEMLAGLAPDRVRALAERHQAALLGGQAGRSPDPRARRRRTSWPEFERRLAKAIETMALETFLILTTPSGDDDAARYYVQFAHATDKFRAEAVTSANLPPSRPLRADQLERLRGLGWADATADAKERNAHRMWSVPPPAPEVANLAVETLRSVYGIAAPGDLRYRYAAFDGPEPPRLSLGIDADQSRPVSRSRSSSRSTTPKPAQQLRLQVERALAAWLGVQRVWADPDGDYPIRSGSAMCFVRLMGGVPPAVSVFSPILRGVAVTPDLIGALDEINARIRYGRVFTSGPNVVVAMELPAISLAPEHIAFACTELGNLADHLDHVLHGRFGGQVAFDTSPKLLN